MFDSWNSRRADAGSCPAGRRVDIDQDFRALNTIEGSQRFFGIVFDCRWNIRVVCRQRELHFDLAVIDLDRLDQAERNDVASKPGIFHRLQRVLYLFLRDRHG